MARFLRTGLILTTVILFAGLMALLFYRPSRPLLVFAQPAGRIYIVREGDALSQIAQQFGVSEQELISTDHLRMQYGNILIYRGQRLIIPAHTGTPAAQTAAPQAAVTALITTTSPVSATLEMTPEITLPREIQATSVVTTTPVVSAAMTITETSMPDSATTETPTSTATAAIAATDTLTASHPMTAAVATPLTTTEALQQTPAVITVTTATTMPIRPIVTALPASVWPALAAPIDLLSPAAGGAYHSPIEIIGLSHTQSGQVTVQLKSEQGELLADRVTTGGAETDFFHTYLRFMVTEPLSATLVIVASNSGNDSGVGEFQIPVALLPGQRLIDINSPQVGARVCNPILIAGYSNTFEANVILELRPPNEEHTGQVIVIGGNLGIYHDFISTFDQQTDIPQPLLVSAYATDASGRYPTIDKTVLPVVAYPPGSNNCP